MQLSEKTKVTASLATIGGCIYGLWVAFQWVDARADMIEANAEAVQVIAKSLRLNTLGDQIGDLKRERRQVKEKLVKAELASNDELMAEYMKDIDEINDELDDLKTVYECVIEGREPCE